MRRVCCMLLMLGLLLTWPLPLLHAQSELINGNRVIVGTLNVCVDLGSTDSYACNMVPPLTVTVPGARYTFKANSENTGPATFALNGMTPKPIRKFLNGALVELGTADICASQMVDLMDQTTYFQMLNQRCQAAGGLGDALTTGTLAQFAPTTSAELAGVLTDEVGTTGGFVRANGTVALATAFAANGANCPAGQFPLGVDASGVAESCTALPTALVGTADQVAVSGATGVVTLSIPTNPVLPGTTTGAFSGPLTGNASTATALATNPANCPAGQFPLGITAAGVAESCTALPTTIAGTTNQITASAATGAVVLSLPTNPVLPGTTTGTFSGPLTGNASTATALAADPTDCPANQFATAIAASGNLSCVQPTFVNLSGSATSAQLPVPTTGLGGKVQAKDCTGVGHVLSINTDSTVTCSTDAGAAGGLGDPGGNGIVVRTSSGTTAARTLTGTSGKLVIANGDGVSANPTFSLGTDVFDVTAAATLTGVTAPATPAAGKGALYVETTNKSVLSYKDDAGVVSTTVKADAGASNTFLTGITSAGVVTKAQPSAANLSNGTSGSGAVLLATTPTLVTPILGVATATSLNNVTLTPPATSATLTLANTKVVTVNSTLTLAGTDGASIAFGAGGTVAYTAGNIATATALAANGANCSAGQFPLGVDASGAVEACTALPTTIAGTTNQIAASAATGAVVLSIPTNPTLPGTTTGTFSGNLTGNVTGNASTATALAADPTDCIGGQFATGIAANGNLTCTAIPGGGNVLNTGTPAAGQLAQWTNATTIQGVSPTLASALFANQGTTTTLLHGNAAGNPSFGAVSLSADVSGVLPPANGGTGAANTATATRFLKGDGTNFVTSAGAASGTGTCTNQFVTALSSDAAPTCTTATLTGAQFANQGTTTTLLHGNAAGNPTFGAVSLTTDVSGILPVANGGSGVTTLAVHGVLLGNAASPMVVVPAAAAGTLFQGNSAASDPSFTATPTLGIAGTTRGTLRLAGNTAGSVTLQPLTSGGVWSLTFPTSGGSTGQFLQTDGAGTTSWASPAGSGTVNAGAAGGPVGFYISAGTAIDDSLGLTLDGTSVLGMAPHVTAVFVDTALTSAHYVLYVTTGATNRTMTLPAASGQTGRKYYIYKADTGVGQVILGVTGTDTLNSVASGTKSISLQDEYLEVTWESVSAWHVVMGAKSIVLTTDVSGILPTANGGTGGNTVATASRYLKGNGTTWATSTGSASGTGACTNQVVTTLNSDAAPTCTTLTSAYVNTSIALTGVDINTSNQVTVTHLAAPLPVNQGGTGTASTLTGLVRGSAGAMTAAELSGDVTTTGSNVTTVANLPTGVNVAGRLFATVIAAPGTPAAGKANLYVDSASKNLALKDDAGVVKHGVQTQAAVSNSFVTAIDDAGAATVAQPTFANLSGSATSAQLPVPTTSLGGKVQAKDCTGTGHVLSINTDSTVTCSADAGGGGGLGDPGANGIVVRTAPGTSINRTLVTAASSRIAITNGDGVSGNPSFDVGADIFNLTAAATATAVVAPATPAAGKGAIYVDSTSKNLSVKDDAGVVKHGVQTQAAVGNSFVTAISDAGAVTVAQPSFTNLSGSVAAGQMPALTGDVTTSAGTVATTIATGAVTLTKMANLATATLIGRTAPGTGVPEALTVLPAALEPAHTGDVTNSAGSLTLTLANIPTAAPMAGSLLATAITAPGTPAAGKGSLYVDSTSKNLAVKDDAGVVKHGVQTTTCTNQVLRSINDAGAGTCATITSGDVNNTVALTGVDINTSNQVTVTHLAAALPIAQGGTGNATGLAATATALAANPANCTVTGTFPVGIDANGAAEGCITLGGVHAVLTTTYQVLAADFDGYKTLPVSSGTFTITLVASASGTTQPAAGKYIHIVNYGSGIVTVARVDQNLNGGTTSLTLPASSATAPTSIQIYSNGTDYFASAALAPGVTTLPSLTSVNGTTIPASATLSTPSSTDTLTNKTLDVEGTGNSITIVSKVWLPAAVCQNATATLIWDTPVASPAVAACITGTNTQKGVADFADGSSLSMQQTLMLPSDWVGAIDARFKWLTTATTGDVVWQMATICVADAETDDPAFNTASTVTDTAKGTTNQTNDATITGVTTTGCAAGELMHIKVLRDSATGADTLAATARLIGVELTMRRAQ